MKNEIRWAIACLLTGFFVWGCAGRNSYRKEVAQKLETMFKNELDNYESVVIIPGSGCTGCISIAEQYFFDNVQNDKIKFIFTSNYSEKGLKLRLKDDNLKRSNVFVDRNNIFYMAEYEERIYPVIVTVENGKVRKINRL